MKSVLNIRQRAQHCVQQKKKPSWTSFVYYFCYLCYSCYFCYKMKCLLFFSDFCYQLKCPGILKIFLPLFLFYMYYSCHTRCSKYTGTIWITLYDSIHQTYFFLTTLKWYLQLSFNNCTYGISINTWIFSFTKMFLYCTWYGRSLWFSDKHQNTV